MEFSPVSQYQARRYLYNNNNNNRIYDKQQQFPKRISHQIRKCTSVRILSVQECAVYYVLAAYVHWLGLGECIGGCRRKKRDPIRTDGGQQQLFPLPKKSPCCCLK